jgi:hypothetical protein
MNRPTTKKLLLKALHNAILWEESCIDANTHMGNRKLLSEMQSNIHRFTKMMDEIAPNRAMTMHEYLDSLPASDFLTLEEIREKELTQSKGDVS